jgi:MYXO-CTERM domain-containing protein
VTYNVSDAAGNRADEVTRTVTVSDTQVPVITLTGAQSASVEVGYSYVDAGATASDVADGDLTASITTVSDVDTSVVGTYTVTYNVSDAAGNVAAQVTRTVQVTADVTVPVITLIGSNVSLELGSIYTDAGATASDNIDGDISATIVTVSDVNTGAVGTYTVTYNVSDAAGNAAAEVTRTVTVTPDVTIPVITLLGDASVSLELGTAYTDAGATAVDNIDGDISASITAVSTVDINTAGTYSVTYSVSDASGNAAAEVSRSVTITPDATKPTITLVGDATVELVVGRVYTDAGATATDNIDGNITASIVVVSTVDANTVGTYTVTYGVSDAAGNAADEVTRTVIVSPFIINLEVPADLVVDATGYLTAVDLGTATATDGDGNAVSVSADQTGPFESGAYTITWTATDADGNTTSETQSLKVNPLANLSPSRSTAEGATPEVKVQLSGMAPTYPVVVPFSISGTATEGDDYTVTQSGSISIAAGSSGVINLTIANDEVAESDETVVITITDPSNAALGSVTQQTLTIVDGNVPPAIELSVSQGDVVGSSVVADLGAVVISVSIDDPNPTDSHTVDWGDGLNLPGAVADPATKTLSFSAAGMVGVTTITADVSDGTDSVMASVSVNVLESAPILASDVDSDGDGISDAEEGYGDSDGDGIPDYADNITVPNAAPSDGGVVETEPGTQITLGSLSLANGDNDISVTEDDLVELGIEPDADFDYPAGLIDFTISGAEPGASYNLVVPLAISIPANSEYRKYFNEDIGWRAFTTVTATGMDPLNAIASASAVDGACPGVDSDAYVSGVNAGDNCLRLTIEDGGPNDVDMTANGTVVDPGGIASFGDGTAPVITLIGDASVSVEVGNAYVDAGATAEDAVDGDISASITADSSVDVDTVGTYTVTYNVSDAAGNAAVEVTRTVSVVLGTPSTSSTAVLSRSGLIANGTDSTTVTVTALNDQGGALRQMTVSGSFGLGSVSAFTEQGDGVYTATVTAGTSIGAGPVTVTITNGQDSVSINSGQIQIRAAEKPRSSGGGGCAVATDGSSDSSLVLVLMLLGMLMLRRRKRSS